MIESDTGRRLDETASPSTPESASDVGNEVSHRSRSRGIRIALVGLVVVLAIGAIAWQQWKAPGYWAAAWEQRTLSPSFRSQSDWAEQLAADTDFDFSKSTIPLEEVRNGGPPKDGIPALSNPKFVSANDASYLRPHERVIGIVLDAEARAYPLKILNYHEIVNDRIADTPFAVTYCPLCDSAMAFDRRTSAGEREFGVSGLLYNSNVLMYDRGEGRDNLWSQLGARGVTGNAADEPLQLLPVELTTWRSWRNEHPETKVLSLETGHYNPYDQNPYGGYFRSPDLMFPVTEKDDRFPAKAHVIGVWTDNESRAYPMSLFSEQERETEDVLDGKKLRIEYDPSAKSIEVVEAEDGLKWVYSLWFSWYAFHPETTVWKNTR